MNQQPSACGQCASCSLASVAVDLIKGLEKIEQIASFQKRSTAVLVAFMLACIPAGVGVWSTLHTTAANIELSLEAAANQRSLAQGQVDSLQQAIARVNDKADLGAVERDELRAEIARNYSRLGGVRTTVNKIADDVNRPVPPPPPQKRWYQR